MKPKLSTGVNNITFHAVSYPTSYGWTALAACRDIKKIACHLGKNTNYEASNYVIFFSLFLLLPSSDPITA
jgi:hypothetical protein